MPTIFNYSTSATEFHIKTQNWLQEELQHWKGCNRNLKNMFNHRMICSRPMYRDDILFTNNVKLLKKNLKVHHMYIIYTNLGKGEGYLNINMVQEFRLL